jgi:hypothetical protein
LLRVCKRTNKKKIKKEKKKDELRFFIIVDEKERKGGGEKKKRTAPDRCDGKRIPVVRLCHQCATLHTEIFGGHGLGPQSIEERDGRTRVDADCRREKRGVAKSKSENS